MRSTYTLAWDDDTFLGKVQFFVRKMWENVPIALSPDLQVKLGGRISLGSACYTVTGTAGKKLKAAIRPLRVLSPLWLSLWFVTWLPLGYLCHMLALPFVRTVVKRNGYDPRTMRFAYDMLSADQYDVCQRVLLRRLVPREQNFRRAEACICAGFEQPTMAAHTRAFLHIGMARVYWYKSDRWAADEEIALAIGIAPEAEKDARQASRVYRDAAKWLDKLNRSFRRADEYGEVKRLRDRAEQLATAVGAKDQLLKQL